MDAEGFELVDMPHMMGCRGAGHAGFKMTDVKLEPKYLLGKEGQGMEVAMHSLAISACTSPTRTSACASACWRCRWPGRATA